MRTGRDYVAAQRDGRSVFVDGERVESVPDHPAFSGVVASIAQLYDDAAASPEMQVEHPELGRINKVFAQPRSVADLAGRRAAITRWAEISHGFAGRSPDHVGGFLAGFASAPSLFDGFHADGGANVLRAYRDVAGDDLFASYAIIPPQNSAARSGDPSSGVSQVGVEEECDGGIIVGGAQTLATGAAVADRLFVSCIKPLKAGDENYALSFMVPVGTPGLKLFCRRPYAVGQPSSYDYPLSSRFDESDAVVVFSKVFVPWEQVFVYRNLDGVREQFHQTAAHVLGNTQAQIRFTVKTKFLLGLAMKLCEANGSIGNPIARDKLGELVALVTIVEGMVLAAESTATADAWGIVKPNPRFLYGIMALQSELYPRILHIVRELTGAGMIGTPSSFRDLVAPETAEDVGRYFGDGQRTAEERAKLFKLAWDAVGSEFGSRHHQYEMFYAGAPLVTRAYALGNYGTEEATGAVERFLASYGLPDHPDDDRQEQR